MTGNFPSVLKTAKAVPVFRKVSKLEYSNYHPISLLSNIEKYCKSLCIKDYVPFSITIALSKTYNLDSDNNIQLETWLQDEASQHRSATPVIRQRCK